jgi:hypothetical protein
MGVAMPSLKMRGPYRLNESTVEEKVTESAPGNFALGDIANDGAVKVEYIGRSDSDINAALKSWVPKIDVDRLFKFSYATSAQAAYERECVHYHDFRPPGRHVHPVPPPGERLRCPHCGVVKGRK